MFIDPNKPLPIATDKKDKLGSVLDAIIEIGRTQKENGTTGDLAEKKIEQITVDVNKKLDVFDQAVVDKLKTHTDKRGAVHGENKQTVGLDKVDNWRMATDDEQELGRETEAYCHPRGLHRLVAKALTVDPKNYIRGGVIPLASGGMLGNVLQWPYPYYQGEVTESPEDPRSYMAQTPWMFDSENGIDIYPVVNGSRVLTQHVADPGFPKRCYTAFGGAAVRVYPTSVDVRRKRPGFLRGWGNDEPNGELLRASAHLFDRNAVYFMEGPTVGVRSFNKNRLQFDILYGVNGRVNNWKGIMESREDFVYNIVSSVQSADLGWGNDIYLVLELDVFRVSKPGMDIRNGAGRPSENISQITEQYPTINYNLPAGSAIKVLKRAGKADALTLKLGDLIKYTSAQKDEIFANLDKERLALVAFTWLNRLHGDYAIRIPVGFSSKDGKKFINYYLDTAFRAKEDTAAKTVTVDLTILHDMSSNIQTLDANFVPTGTGRFTAWNGDVRDTVFHPKMFDGVFSRLGGHIKTYTYYNRQYIMNYKHEISTVKDLINMPENALPKLASYTNTPISTYNQDGFYGDHLRHIPILFNGDEIHYAVQSRDWQNKYRWSIAVVEKDTVPDPSVATGTHIGPWRKSIKWIRQDRNGFASSVIYNTGEVDAISIDALAFNSMNNFTGYANYTYDQTTDNNPIQWINKVDIDDPILTWLGRNGGGWIKNIRQMFMFNGKLFFFSQTTDASEIKADGTDCYYGWISNAFVEVSGDKRTVKINGDISALAVVKPLKVNTAETLKVDQKTILGLDQFDSSDVYIMRTNKDQVAYKVMVNLGPMNNYYFHFTLIENKLTGKVTFQPDTNALDPALPFNNATNGFDVDIDKLSGFGKFSPHRFHINWQSPVMHNKSMWSMCATPGNYNFTSDLQSEWIVTGGVMTNIDGASILPVGAVTTISGGNAVVKSPVSARANEYGQDELFVRMEGSQHVLYGVKNNPKRYPVEPHSGGAPVGFIKDGTFYHYDPDGWKNALLPVVDGKRMNYYGYGSSFPVFLGTYGEAAPINRFFLVVTPTKLAWTTTVGRNIPIKGNPSITVNGTAVGYDGSGTFRIPDQFTGTVNVELTGLTVIKWADGLSTLTEIGSSVVALDFSNSTGFNIVAKLPPRITSLANVFKGARGQLYQGMETWNVDKVVDFTSMFENAAAFNHDISKWDTSSAQDMTNMFKNAKEFNQAIETWDVSKVTTMQGMFDGAAKFAKPLTKWNVSKVINFSRMFANTNLYSPVIIDWNVSNGTDFSFMFLDAKPTNLNISRWNVSKAITMESMFEGIFTYGDTLLDLRPWKLTSLTNGKRMFARSQFNGNTDGWSFGLDCWLTEMFMEASKFNTDISTWDVSNVINCAGMFRRCTSFSKTWVNANWANCGDFSYMFESSGFSSDLVGWKFAQNKPIIMRGMFQNTATFNAPGIGEWDVSNVINMQEMFANSAMFNSSLAKWRPGKCVTMESMFLNAPVYNQVMTEWTVGKVENFKDMFNGAQAFAQTLPDWDVSSGVNFRNMFRTAFKFNSDLNKWNMSEAVDISDMFREAAQFNGNVSSWDVSKVKYMNGTFVSCSVFNQDISKWDTGQVINFTSTFNGCPLFNSDLSAWDTKSATTLDSMFERATAFTSNLDAWDVSNVTSMKRMFYNAGKFNSNLTDWNVNNVKDFSSVFQHALSFEGDLSKWNTASAETMAFMFDDAPLFSSDLSGWDVSNVTNFSGMFKDNVLMVADISNWDVSKGTTFDSMFAGANAFNQAIGKWVTTAATNMNSMFANCVVFNQDLSSWTVGSVTTHTNFDLNTPAWALPKPNFPS